MKLPKIKKQARKNKKERLYYFLVTLSFSNKKGDNGEAQRLILREDKEINYPSLFNEVKNHISKECNTKKNEWWVRLINVQEITKNQYDDLVKYFKKYNIFKKRKKANQNKR